MSYGTEYWYDEFDSEPQSGGNPNYFSNSASNMVQADDGGNALGSGLFEIPSIEQLFAAAVGSGAVTNENASTWTGKGDLGDDYKPKTADFGQGEDQEKGFMEKAGGMLEKGASWIQKNQKATNVILGAIGGAYSAEEKRKAAEAVAQSRLNAINQTHNNATADRNAYNASFAQTKRATPGIIQSALKRLDGTEVFKNGSLRK